jgi:hypothetical protein
MPHAPHWSIGMQKLAADVYFDGECIHFDRWQRREAIAWFLIWLEHQYRPLTLFDLS